MLVIHPIYATTKRVSARPHNTIYLSSCLDILLYNHNAVLVFSYTTTHAYYYIRVPILPYPPICVLILEYQQRRSRRWTYPQTAYYYHYIRVLILGHTPISTSIRALYVLVYQQICRRSWTYRQTAATRSTPHSSTPL